MDQLLLNLWKMFKYSAFEFSVFEKVQESEGLTPFKILKCATTRRLSHGTATLGIISCFSPLVDALDTYFEKHDAEVKGVRDLLLRPVILFLLLLTKVLVHVNRFLRFLKSRYLVYTTIPRKLSQLISNYKS